MTWIAAALPILALLAAAGCAHSEAIHRSLYQGLQAREELVTRSPGFRSPGPRPSYEEYDAVRRRLLDSSATR